MHKNNDDNKTVSCILRTTGAPGTFWVHFVILRVGGGRGFRVRGRGAAVVIVVIVVIVVG